MLPELFSASAIFGCPVTMSWDHDSYTVRRYDGLMGSTVLAGHGDYVIIADYCHYCGHPQAAKAAGNGKKKTQLETNRQIQRRTERDEGSAGTKT